MRKRTVYKFYLKPGFSRYRVSIPLNLWKKYRPLTIVEIKPNIN